MKIAMLNTARHLHSLGGVGFFNNAFVEAFGAEHIIHFVCDKKPKNSPFANITNTKTYYNDVPVRTHQTEKLDFFFKRDSFNMAKFLDMEKALIKAVSENYYDLFIINCQEWVFPLLRMRGYWEAIKNKTIYYVHTVWNEYALEEFERQFLILQNENVPIAHEYSNMMQRLQLKHNSNFVELPLLNNDCFEKFSNTPKDFNKILFSARWGKEKRPMMFVEFLKKNPNFEPIIITNTKGKQKFMEFGVPESNIHVEVFGEEKLKIMSQCQFLYHPADQEAVCYVIKECLNLNVIPIVDKQADWIRHMDYLHNCLDLSESPRLIPIEPMNFFSIQPWKEFFESIPKITKPTSSAKVQLIEKSSGISVQDVLGTTTPTIEDLIVLEKLASMFKVHQTPDASILYCSNLVYQEKPSTNMESIFE